jgi:hypothetical protein
MKLGLQAETLGVVTFSFTHSSCSFAQAQINHQT